MKKIISFLLVALVAMLVLPINGLAEDDETMAADNTEEPVDLAEDTAEIPEADDIEAGEVEELEGDAGITPDSPLWGIDNALDRISYLLTVGPEARAKKGLAIANERLLEIKEMSAKNKVKALEKAEKAHGKILADVKEDVAEIDGEAEPNVAKITGIELGMANHLAALAKVRAKIAENPNISEETKAKLDAKFTVLEARAEEVQAKVLNKKEQIRIRAEEQTRLRAEQPEGEEAAEAEAVEGEEAPEAEAEEEASDKGKQKGQEEAEE